MNPRCVIANVVFLAVILSAASFGQAQTSSGQPFVVEYYYKAKWGHADEMGRMVKVWMDQPRYHTTEDGRWDFRVTIVFKNATVANEPFEEDALKKQLWPDQETYTREEQRRFEILDAHWDLPIRNVDLDGKP